MFDLRFESELDDNGRISVPAEILREIPAHTRITVEVKVPSGGNGTLEYYMTHPLTVEGMLPFNRESLYSDRS